MDILDTAEELLLLKENKINLDDLESLVEPLKKQYKKMEVTLKGDKIKLLDQKNQIIITIEKGGYLVDDTGRSRGAKNWTDMKKKISELRK